MRLQKSSDPTWREKRWPVRTLLERLRQLPGRDELVTHWKNERRLLLGDTFGSLVDSWTERDIEQILCIAYAVRNIEIRTGKHMPYFEDDGVGFSEETSRAFAEAHTMAQRLGHRKITVYHLLESILAAPSITRELQLHPRLKAATFDAMWTGDDTPAADRGEHELTHEARAAVDRSREEAIRRSIDPIIPAVVLYALVDTSASVVTLIEGVGIDVREFKRALERLLGR